MKVFVVTSFPPPGVQMLKEKFEVDEWDSLTPIPRAEFLRRVSDADALFTYPAAGRVDEELLAAAPNLKVVGTLSVGFDHIDRQACLRRGIKVGYTPTVLTESVAEMAITLALTVSRRIMEANRNVHNGGWGGNDLLWMCGSGLEESVVGIVGLGRIGTSLARKVRAFNPSSLLYHDVYPNPQAGELGAESRELKSLLKESDFVFCCCALTEGTKLLFNSRVFGHMKEGSIFVNISRGGLVDQDALYEALTTEGGLKAAALDVTTPEPLPTDHPLLSLPNCLITPHVASATVATRCKMSKQTAENIIAGLEDRPLPSPLPLS